MVGSAEEEPLADERGIHVDLQDTYDDNDNSNLDYPEGEYITMFAYVDVHIATSLVTCYPLVYLTMAI